MKHKLTLLFALLCASMMGWAQYCDYATGHENNANFGDANGRILLSLEPTNNADEFKLTIKPNYANGATKKLDYMYVIANGNNPYPAESGVDKEGEGYDELSVTFTNTSASTSFTIQWSHPDWPGRWQCALNDVDLDALVSCVGVGEGGGECTDTEKPSISAATISDITYNSAVLTVTATDNEAVSRYVIKNGDVQIGSGNTNVITLKGLTSNTTYNLKVFAYDACNNESDGFVVSEFKTENRESECIGAKGHFGNPSEKKVYYQIDYENFKATISLRSLTGYDLDFAEVHIGGTGGGNYAMNADGMGGYIYTINTPEEGTEWYIRFLYSDKNMGGNEQTSQDLNASDANAIYYKIGQCISSKEKDVNVALASKGTSAIGTEAENNSPSNAIDGNIETRWSSEWDKDPQDFILDLGQRRAFNTIQFVWYTTYSKAFDILISDDQNEWVNILSVNRTLENADKKEEDFSLNGTYTARYIKFHGTERGAGYGHSFREIRVILPGVSTLTTIDLNAANTIAKVGGEGIALTTATKDQNGVTMDGVEITYEVSPMGAGNVVDGKYIPAKIGEATIVAKSGEVVSNPIQVFGLTGENLALNKPATAGANETPVAEANDASLSSFWSLGPNQTEDKMWWCVDLEETYDLSLVIIKWEGACPTEHAIQVSTDNTNWTDAATLSGLPEIGTATDHKYQFYSMSSAARYIRVKASALRDKGWGMKIYDFQAFGTLAATPTKPVSASVNDATMGSATVKQEGEEVTEVSTGSEVTFSAVANDGYVFVEWSNGEKNATFTTTVDAALNLTATFRKLGTTYCNTEYTAEKEGITYNVYVTYKKTTNENEYTLVVRSPKAMVNFSNAYVSHSPIGETNQTNMNGLGVLTDGGKTLSYTFTSLIEPGMNSPLYINFVKGEGSTEVTFPRLTNIEFAVSCEDNVEVESIALEPAETTIEVGGFKTLVPIFTPAYAINQIVSWSSSDESKVSVSTDGVIGGNAVGEAIITATSANGKIATCNVTVNTITEKTWWGLTTIAEWDNMPVMYSITRNIDKTLTYTVYFGGDASGKVMQINNGGYNTLTGYTDSERKASFTTTTTYESGTQIKPDHFFFFGGPRIELANEYVVGASNEKPSTAVESVVISHSTVSLMKDETIQLVASVVPSFADDKTLVWSSDDTNIATVDNNGLVTAVAEGATTITATSNNGKTASCVVTVVGALEPATWYGTAVFEVKGNPVAVNYSITRTSDRTLTYRTVLSETLTGIFMQLNDGEYRPMTQDATGRIAEWTSTNTYEDGATHSMFFYPEFEGGANRWDVVNYIVGSSNEKPNTLVAFGDQADNTAKIAEYADKVVDAYINRTFPNTDEWYTLCLPFDMDEAQLAATFGAGYTLATLGNSEDRGSLIHLNFNYVNTLEAGKPYLLKPGVSTATVPMIEDVTIKNVGPSAAPQKAESAHMHFQGTFVPTTLEGDNKRFVGPNNYLYSPAEGGTNMKSFRCYFTIPVESQALVGSKAARIVLGPQVATGTENVQSDQVQSTKVIIDGTLYIIRGGRTYNAQGQLVK